MRSSPSKRRKQFVIDQIALNSSRNQSQTGWDKARKSTFKSKLKNGTELIFNTGQNFYPGA